MSANEIAMNITAETDLAELIAGARVDSWPGPNTENSTSAKPMKQTTPKSTLDRTVMRCASCSRS